MEQFEVITIKVKIEAPVSKVWDCFTKPEHIIMWNNASDDWHTTAAENDLRETGTFNYRMEAKDGSVGFDFGGTYTKVILHELIEYTLTDNREVSIQFAGDDQQTNFVEIFDAEKTNPLEMQRFGWQSILDNFKKYTEHAS